MFAELLAHPGVEEHCELRSPFGFMAIHGGALEEMTDVVAREAAARSGASYYAVLQPPGMRVHIPSTEVGPAASTTMVAFLAHVEVVVSLHGFGRDGFWRSLLLGGANRDLAEHLAGPLRAALPGYQVVTDLAAIPRPLRGLHPDNPVNRPRQGGAQLELPPRVRGNTPAERACPGPSAALVALVDALAEAACCWTGSGAQGASRSTTQAAPGSARR